ncbi:hypothetical protein KCU77_g1587, partial [Aureobasidium melanogenum]
MESTIHPPSKPIALNSNYIAGENRTLGLRCPDRHFRDAVVCDETGFKLFDFNAKELGTSWTLRRRLVGSKTKQHILDLRHTKMDLKTWILEDSSGNKVCKIKDVTSSSAFRGSGFTAVDAQVLANDSEEVIIEMRCFDKAGSRTSFQSDGAVIAELTLMDNNDASFLHKRGLDRTTWKLEVAKGVDITLVVGLAFARAEIMHAWRR